MDPELEELSKNAKPYAVRCLEAAQKLGNPKAIAQYQCEVTLYNQMSGNGKNTVIDLRAFRTNEDKSPGAPMRRLITDAEIEKMVSEYKPESERKIPRGMGLRNYVPSVKNQ